MGKTDTASLSHSYEPPEHNRMLTMANKDVIILPGFRFIEVNKLIKIESLYFLPLGFPFPPYTSGKIL